MNISFYQIWDENLKYKKFNFTFLLQNSPCVIFSEIEQFWLKPAFPIYSFFSIQLLHLQSVLVFKITEIIHLTFTYECNLLFEIQIYFVFLLNCFLNVETDAEKSHTLKLRSQQNYLISAKITQGLFLHYEFEDNVELFLKSPSWCKIWKYM